MRILLRISLLTFLIIGGTALSTIADDATPPAPAPAPAPATPTATLTGHTTRILALAFSPDCTRLASASDDGTLKIWDVAAKKELFSIPGLTSNQNKIRFTPDGESVITIGGDSDVLIIETKTGKVKNKTPDVALSGGPSPSTCHPTAKPSPSSAAAGSAYSTAPPESW